MDIRNEYYQQTIKEVYESQTWISVSRAPTQD